MIYVTPMELMSLAFPSGGAATRRGVSPGSERRWDEGQTQTHRWIHGTGLFAYQYMDVSKNRGTPKWMVKIKEIPIKMDDLGVPLFLETPICQCTYFCFVINVGKRWIPCIHPMGKKWQEILSPSNLGKQRYSASVFKELYQKHKHPPKKIIVYRLRDTSPR